MLDTKNRACTEYNCTEYTFLVDTIYGAIKYDRSNTVLLTAKTYLFSSFGLDMDVGTNADCVA